MMTERKRARGEGTVRDHKGGLKEARLYIPKELRHKTGGKARISFYGPTEAAALRKKREFERDLEKGFSLESRKLTVGEYLRRWLDGPLKRRVSARTLQDYRYHAEKHLMPPDCLGYVKLYELTAEDLENLYERKLDEDVGVSTVRYVHTTIRAALQNAVKKRLIPYNPARDADAPRMPERGERPTLSFEQLEAFFRAAGARRDRFEALFVLAASAGLRPGELLALKWPDLTLPDDPRWSGSARIRRSVEHTKEHGLVLRETTKTRRRRTVPLFPEIVEALKAHRLRQLDERLRYDGAWEDQDLVFPNKKGGIMRIDNLRYRHFKPLLEAAGLPSVRLYDLRHSFSTLWVESGEDLELLQRILGHTSIKTTADVYVHLGEASKKRAMERFGRNYRVPKGPSEGSENAV
jgi:integrase